MNDLMTTLKGVYEAKEYDKARKLIKEIYMLNRQLELRGVDEYIKSVRKEILSALNS